MVNKSGSPRTCAYQINGCLFPHVAIPPIISFSRIVTDEVAHNVKILQYRYHAPEFEKLTMIKALKSLW